MKDKIRSLTAAEQKLWQKVTKDVENYRQSTTTFEAMLGEEKADKATISVSRPMLSKTPVVPVASRAPEPRSLHLAEPRLKSVDLQSVFASGDPKIERRVRRGRIEIDAVLDLHGSTQSVAHQRLTQFITLARHQHARCVLVITGKGIKRYADHEPSTLYGASKFSMDPERAPRGILRALFLQWVEDAPLRNQIIRVAAAKPADGGAGAFYVFLRKKHDQR